MEGCLLSGVDLHWLTSAVCRWSGNLSVQAVTGLVAQLTDQVEHSQVQLADITRFCALYSELHRTILLFYQAC